MTNDPSQELSNGEKLRVLKEEIQKGLADIHAGRVHEWNFEEFLRRARIPKPDQK